LLRFPVQRLEIRIGVIDGPVAVGVVLLCVEPDEYRNLALSTTPARAPGVPPKKDDCSSLGTSKCLVVSQRLSEPALVLLLSPGYGPVTLAAKEPGVLVDNPFGHNCWGWGPQQL